MANSVQEIKNVTQSLKELAEQAKSAKTPLNILSGYINKAIESGSIEKIDSASKAVQNFYSSIEAGRNKSAIDLKRLVNTEALLSDLQKVRFELNALAEQISVAPTRNAVWTGPTDKQQFAPQSVVRQATRDMQAEFEARAQAIVQSNPAFQVTPAQAQKQAAQDLAAQQSFEEAVLAKEQQRLKTAGQLDEAFKRINETKARSVKIEQDISLADQEQKKLFQKYFENIGTATSDPLAGPGRQNLTLQSDEIQKTVQSAKELEAIRQKSDNERVAKAKEALAIEEQIVATAHNARFAPDSSKAMLQDVQSDPVYQAELNKQRQAQSAQIQRQFQQQVEAFRLQQSQQNLQENPFQAISSVFGGNGQQINSLRQQLVKLGLDTGTVANGFGNLKRVSTEASTGVSALSFSMTDASGITRDASVHVDKFGRVLQDTSGKFQNFGDLIGRNTVKVLEWAVSLTLVYGSIQKISELTAMMGKLQQEMVEIGITTGQTGQYLTNLFDEVKKISDVTASDFGTGIQSLNVALRATSGTADQAERASQALILLKDSMTLAKLAGIDNAQSMDYLIASLKQMDMSLQEGSILLDKFQAVSQASNTSIEDLAATFSITAGAAQDVGVTVDQLTGLIGAFAEATTLSATETGNALRAMFSNFTQPQGIETLNKYGIAVKNVDGTFRSFIEVFKQASELSKSGILNERQIADLANALGGGSRRQAQVTALLTVEPRSEALASISQFDSAGKAQAALAQKTVTLQSANERLQNSFDNLARTLGGEGAFLNHLTSAVNILSTLLDLVSKLTSSLGPSTSALIGYGVAMAALSKYGPNLVGLLGGIPGSVSGTLKGAVGNLNIPRTIDNGPGIEPTQLGNSQVWAIAGKNMAGAMVPVILSAFSQLQSGNTPAAIGNVIGGGLLAILSGNPLWAIIGSTIGQAAASAIQEAQTQYENYTKAKESKVPTLTGKETPEQLSQIQEQAASGIQGLSSFALGRSQAGQRVLVQAGQTVSGIFGGQLTTSEQLLKAVENYKTALSAGKEFASYDLAQTFGFSVDEIKKAAQYKDLLNQIVSIEKNRASIKQETGLDTTDPNYKGLSTLKDLNKELDISFERTKRFDLIQKLGTGEISKSDYKDRIENAIPQSTFSASQALIALNPQLKNADSAAMKPFLADFQKLKELFASVSLEDRNFLNETISNISQTREKIDNLNAAIVILKASAGTGFFDKGALEADNAQLSAAQTLLSELIAQFNAVKQAALSAQDSFKFKGFTDLTDLSSDQKNKALADARKLQSFYEKQVGIPPGTVSKFVDDFIIGWKGGFETVKGLQTDFLSFVVQANQKAAQDMANAFNFQNLRNIEASQKGRLQQAINYYTALLKQYGFNEQNQLITVLFKDNQVGQLIGSQTALQLALQDLTDVTKKQLDGIYNLPSGATAYIPLSAGQLLSNYTSNTAANSMDYGNFPTPVIEKGNSILQQIDNGIQTLIDITGKPVNLQAQVAKEQAGLESGQYKTIYEALMANSIFNNKAGPPAPTGTGYTNPISPFNNNYNKPPTDPNATITPSLMTSLVSQLARLVTNITNPNAGLGKASDLLRPPGLASAPVNVTVTPAKIEASYNTTTTLRLDGRVLWTSIKKYAFEDFARFSSAVGNSSRSRTNVI